MNTTTPLTELDGYFDLRSGQIRLNPVKERPRHYVAPGSTRTACGRPVNVRTRSTRLYRRLVTCAGCRRALDGRA